MAKIEEAGTYEGVIGAITLGELKNEKRTPYLDMTLVSGDDYAWHKAWLSDKAMPYTLRLLRELGWTGDDVTDTASLENQVADKPVTFTIEINDEGFANVERVRAKGAVVGSAQTSTVGDATRAKLRAMSKALCKDLALPTEAKQEKEEEISF